MNKKLSLLDCVMLIMGSMIGSGIFIVPAAMSGDLQSPTMLIFAWLVTALLTIFAALSYGELAALMPKAGGQYVYLKEAYNKLIAFLYGWTFFTVTQTGTIAAVAMAFAIFCGAVFPVVSDDMVIVNLFFISISIKQLVAIAVVWILTFINFNGVKTGALIQNIFTITKIGALLFMIGAGVYAFAVMPSAKHIIDWSLPEKINTYNYWGIFCCALVGSIFSSDAWNNITFTGGEIENAKRNLPLSLIIGTVSVMALYIFINYIYLYNLPFEAIANANQGRVGTLLLNTILGKSGMFIMAVLIMISTFGCVNGLALTGARVYYAMAKDGLFIKQAATLNKNNVPQFALIIQAIWTSLLTLSGSYGNLLDYVVTAALIFYILTVAGVFVLRKKQPNTPRTYKVWGYPIVPAVYILIAMFVCINLLLYKSSYTLPGVLIVLSGIPVFWFVNRKK